MSDRPQTPYAETEVLLAILEENYERATALLADMTETELRIFADQVDRLAGWIAMAVPPKA